MTAWLALALLAQEDVEELLRRLDADSIEARTEAADRLLQRGPSILPVLEKARLGAEGELRVRLDALLVRAKDRERLSALLKPATRLTLELKRKPLREVIALLRERAPTLVEAEEGVAELPVTVSLTDVPFWRALESIARGAGAVRVEADDAGARFVAGTPGPVAVFDTFAARLETLTTAEEVELGTPGRSFRTSLRFRLCWEKGTRPTRIRAILERFEEDTGRNGLQDLPQAPEAVLAQPLTEAGAELTLSFSGVPSAAAERLSVRVAIEADFALRWGELRFPVPWAEGQSRDNADFGAKLVQLEQRPGQVSVGLHVYPRGKPVAADVGAILDVRDESGRSTPHLLWNPMRTGTSMQFSALFAVPTGRPPKELRLSVPVEVHTERYSVDLPDLRIR